MIPARSSNELFRRQAGDFAELLGGGKTVLLASHQSPDGDAVASLLAAARIVEMLGSRTIRALEGVVPERFSFLPGSEHIYNSPDVPSESYDAFLMVDCGSLARIGDIGQRIRSNDLIVNIDHHPDNTQFGRLNIVYPQASSTTELLYDIITALNLPLDPVLALLLYTGLMTDTGSFRYSSTSAESFAMAEHLVEVGVDPSVISDSVFSTNSLGGVKLLGEAMNSLELRADGRIASMIVQQPETYEELEEITDIALTIKGVRAIALFRVSKTAIRVSLRARGDYDVAKIARKYGGGGHQKAAGFTYYGPLDEIRALALEELSDEVEEKIPPTPLDKGGNKDRVKIPPTLLDKGGNKGPVG
jgi:phosphoesterase RecJ-like protein